MKKNIQVIVMDKGQFLNEGIVVYCNSIADRLNNYRNNKIENFKKSMIVFYGKVLQFGEKAIDIYDEVDGVINDGIDNFIEKTFAYYDDLKDRIKTTENKEKGDSSFEKLMPMMSDDSMKKLGIDMERDEQITELKEFKKELLIENYHNEEFETDNKGRNRGTLYVWMAALCSVLLMGVLIAISIIKK